ncbi:MAG: peptide-methionine (R)-S-oxide reductase MsrB [Nitrospirales bacterium]|nr:peptide-methionine (R)-S-oxide reductase MsrB [Nitrospirales bacterium]
MSRRALVKISLLLGLEAVGKTLGMFAPFVYGASTPFIISKSNAEWRAQLTPMQFRVLREEATEPPYQNAYYQQKTKGQYHCTGCDLPLFSSETKYDSQTGWPSFWAPLNDSVIGTKTDWKLLYPRTEVHCARCGGHLGHVFNDGPQPTGLRYCINSVSLKFVST